jgi:hypothetical protein
VKRVNEMEQQEKDNSPSETPGTPGTPLALILARFGPSAVPGVALAPRAVDEGNATAVSPQPNAPMEWDAAEADRLLTRIKLEVQQSLDQWGTTPPQVLVGLGKTWLRVAERYVREHEQESARGCNPLDLLRGVLPSWRDTVANCPRTAESRTDCGRDTPLPTEPSQQKVDGAS